MMTKGGRKVVKKTKLAVIGVGARGKGLMTNLARMEDVEIIAVCDRFMDRAEAARDTALELTGLSPRLL